MVLSSPGVPGGASCHRSITIVLVLFLIASKRTTRTIPAELANHQLASCRSRGSDSDTPASTTNVGQATICPLAIFRGPGKDAIIRLLGFVTGNRWIGGGPSELECRPTDSHAPELPFDFTDKVSHGHVVRSRRDNLDDTYGARVHETVFN